HFPALRFRVARIHAGNFRGEQSRFVASRARANFEDDVLLVVGIFGQQQHLEFFLDLADARFELVELFLRVGPHLGIFLVGQNRLALGDALLQVFVLAILLYYRRDVAVRLRGLLVFRRVTGDLGRGERLRQLFIAGLDLV